MNVNDLSRLVRFPLVLSAVGDPMAGLFLAGERNALPYLGVALAAAFLYMGGMALNDLFDREFDRRRHPHRVLPAGRVRPSQALGVGAMCMTAGVATGCFVRLECGATALLLSVAVLLYDGGLKRSTVAGCVGMGVCRALNVLTGVAAGAGFSPPTWLYGVAIVHGIYIAGVTGLSLLEEQAHPVTRQRLCTRLVPSFLAVVLVPVLFFSLYPWAATIASGLLAIRLLRVSVFGPARFTRTAVAKTVGDGVRGVLLLNTAYLWGAGGWALGSGVLGAYVLLHLGPGRRAP